MKPTRNIVKPNSNLWKAKGKVWYKHNDDGDSEMSEEFNQQRKEVLNMLEEKENKRNEEIRKVKSSNMPAWEKKMTLRAIKSPTYGWGAND
jgi:hypothetical protein